MGSRVTNNEIGAAIEQIVNGFAALQSAGIEPANARDSITLIQEVEQVRRLADHAAVEVMAVIDESRFHLGDGHSSAKTMVRHHAKLSNGEAAARERVARLTETCPDIGEAYRSGALGTDQIRSLSLVHANPRIRHLMPARQDWFLARAKTMRHIDFEARINRWKRLVDEDGPTPPNERAHEDRNARMTQNFDTTWDFVASFASVQGLQAFEVFDRYVDAETLADWEKARAEHGDAATSEHLPRTIQQRRADALWQIFIDAAANPNSAVPADFMNNIMWDPDTFEAMAEKFFGEEDNDATDLEDDDDIAESDTTAPSFPRRGRHDRVPDHRRHTRRPDRDVCHVDRGPHPTGADRRQEYGHRPRHRSTVYRQRPTRREVISYPLCVAWLLHAGIEVRDRSRPRTLERRQNQPRQRGAIVWQAQPMETEGVHDLA